MKVAFVVNYFDFRSDIRKVIEQVGLDNQIVLFCKNNEIEVLKKYANTNIEIRIIDERRASFTNTFWSLLFLFFGKIPKSHRNFYLTELFRLNREKKTILRWKGRIVLELKRFLPHFLTYDSFLNHLNPGYKTKIDDIDQFYFFTDIYDHYLLARVIKENKPASVYVYSWDHPCKFLRFSKKVKYLVWSKGLKDDLQELQHINPQQIRVIGASQFAYLHRFLQIDKQKLQSPYDFKYIYFGCSVATPKLVEEEVKVVKVLSEILLLTNSSFKLVIRPYPILDNWKYYEPLKSLPNILFDDQYRNADKSINEDSLLEKYTKIYFAQGFFHLGTTLGLEACFTDTPSFIVDFDYLKKTKGYITMHYFIHQYQNEKYVLLDGFPNTIKNPQDLKPILSALYQDKTTFTAYNRAVTRDIALLNFAEFAERLIDSEIFLEDRTK